MLAAGQAELADIARQKAALSAEAAAARQVATQSGQVRTSLWGKAKSVIGGVLIDVIGAGIAALVRGPW